MKEKEQNKMAIAPMNKLILKMGLPMIISMVLQALYNVIDSIFVANMGSKGAIANQALTYAFPIQIMIIAIGVGTGVGLNALLSKSLGENDKEKVNKIAGNGIFLSICIYIVFLLFGLFGSRWFISLFTTDNEIIKMGTSYLKICTCLSLGSIGYTVYERFLQATGKTLYSTIAQISGAVINILFDYIFIFPLNMGASGAAYATIFGQIVSFLMAMIFHYLMNKEINGNIKYMKPNLHIIKEIYSIGISAALMQGLLSIMMAGMNMILSKASVDSKILVGAFGIYYKIQQVALFSAFGLSNTIITVLSFNYGMNNKERSKECIRYGIIDSLIVALVITILFEIIARPLATLFSLSGGSTKDLIDVCEKAVRISSIGYVFMAFSIAVQGVFQALRYSLKPLITALFRLVIFVFPIAYLFTLSNNVLNLVWFTFPIAEILTAIISYFMLRDTIKRKIDTIPDLESSNHLFITISRMHGTNAKLIGKMIAQRLNIKFYDKELVMLEAKKRRLTDKYINNIDEDGYSIYLSLDANKESMIAQKEAILELAKDESFVIIGRCADDILKNNKNLLRVFLYANEEYRIQKIMELYGDSKEEAINHMKKSDEARSKYYTLITNKNWADQVNYDLYLDVSKGIDYTVEEIVNAVNKMNE